MNSKEEIDKAYEIVQDLFPDLIIINNEKLYFYDPAISNRYLYAKVSLTHIDLIGYHLVLALFINSDIKPYGVLTTNHDFNLSDMTCMELYKNNISVMYPDHFSPNADDQGWVNYDMISIHRRLTIKNIIND